MLFMRLVCNLLTLNADSCLYFVEQTFTNRSFGCQRSGRPPITENGTPKTRLPRWQPERPRISTLDTATELSMRLDDLVTVAHESELPELVSRLRALATALEDVARSGPAGIETGVTISEWVAAKRAVPILVGKMNGHPNIRDGNVGATTELFYLDQASGLVRTFNRWYRLGPSMLPNDGKLQ